MVKHSMDLLELLRKRGIDGDVDFLREALRVLVDGIMDAEVSAQIGAQHGERSPERVTYRHQRMVERRVRAARFPRHQGPGHLRLLRHPLGEPGAGHAARPVRIRRTS